MANNKVILHVGLVKAASTKLQRSLFPEHPQVTFLGKPHDPRLKDLIEHACWADFGDFDEGRLRRHFENVIQPLLEVGNKSIVISNEQLTQTERMNRTMVARRLRTLLGECRVIVVIRNQLTWLESMYFWDFGNGNVRGSFETYLFLNWRGSRSGVGNARFIDYASLTKSYADVFGQDNVGVFLFEELGKDPRAFARRLCRFIGIDEEAGAKTLNESREMARMSRIQYLRVKYGIVPHAKLSRLVPPTLNTLIQKVGGQPKHATASPEWVRRVEDFYRESNRKVAQQHGLPLEEFGYPF